MKGDIEYRVMGVDGKIWHETLVKGNAVWFCAMLAEKYGITSDVVDGPILCTFYGR